MIKEDKNKKREERHKITQEDFTPPCVVEDMLKKLPQSVFFDFKKTVMDNSCGIGNFLIAILEKRLKNCTSIDNVVNSIKTIYGVELMADNVKECRERIYNTIIKHYSEIVNDYEINFKIKSIIRNRIQWCDSFKFDYNHWPSLSMKPRKGHMNVSFDEVKREEDTKYPMWHKENIQLTLFSDKDFI